MTKAPDTQKLFLPQDVNARLRAIYEEVMWLARRPNTTSSMARAWYTHVAGGRLATKLRLFSGLVSKAAIAEEGVTWRLEHFKRIQTTLTQLVERHVVEGIDDPEEFLRTIVDCEQVHLVTFHENYAAMSARGDYKAAGIELVAWKKVPPELQRLLWSKCLRGRVANAVAFAPRPEHRFAFLRTPTFAFERGSVWRPGRMVPRSGHPCPPVRGAASAAVEACGKAILSGKIGSPNSASRA